MKSGKRITKSGTHNGRGHTLSVEKFTNGFSNLVIVIDGLPPIDDPDNLWSTLDEAFAHGELIVRHMAS